MFIVREEKAKRLGRRLGRNEKFRSVGVPVTGTETSLAFGWHISLNYHRSLSITEIPYSFQHIVLSLMTKSLLCSESRK